MACVLTSDDRVGEVLLSRVVCDQLAEVSSSEGLLMETQTMENEHDERIVTQLALMIRKIGDAVEKDGELNDTIDGIVGKMSNKSNYWKVAEHVFEDGHITWERIAVLFYVAGRIAVKVVIAHLPQYVKDILTWTLEYFKSKLLSWVQDNGGWLNSFSELARVQVERMNSMSGWTSGIFLVFIGGVLLGSVITWKLARRT
ncbi:apoptosis regulator BAX-like [Esox lucius]|uniref:Bcl-2 Bcl-2 homology region 1-3 domain-containing protein n=1 Tax=Esox lucius TaxID=8010 RepID=A0AAY5KE31_ESOLU|nr:apoptosis regulator BAX-like [Esox lucius]